MPHTTGPSPKPHPSRLHPHFPQHPPSRPTPAPPTAEHPTPTPTTPPRRHSTALYPASPRPPPLPPLPRTARTLAPAPAPAHGSLHHPARPTSQPPPRQPNAGNGSSSSPTTETRTPTPIPALHLPPSSHSTSIAGSARPAARRVASSSSLLCIPPIKTSVEFVQAIDADNSFGPLDGWLKMTMLMDDCFTSFILRSPSRLMYTYTGCIYGPSTSPMTSRCSA